MDNSQYWKTFYNLNLSKLIVLCLILFSFLWEHHFLSTHRQYKIKYSTQWSPQTAQSKWIFKLDLSHITSNKRVARKLQVKFICSTSKRMIVFCCWLVGLLLQLPQYEMNAKISLTKWHNVWNEWGSHAKDSQAEINIPLYINLVNLKAHINFIFPRAKWPTSKSSKSSKIHSLKKALRSTYELSKVQETLLRVLKNSLIKSYN